MHIIKDGAYFLLLCIRSAHLKKIRFPIIIIGGVFKYKNISVRFETIRRKQNLASAFGIQKENWG